MSKKIERLLARTEITASSTALEVEKNADEIEERLPQLVWHQEMKVFIPATTVGLSSGIGVMAAPSVIALKATRGYVEPFIINIGNFLADYQLPTFGLVSLTLLVVAVSNQMRNNKTQNRLVSRMNELRVISNQMKQVQTPPVDVEQLPENVQQALALTMETIREYYETSEAYHNSVATFQVHKMTENLSRALNLYLDLNPKKRTAGSPITEELLEQLRAVDMQARTAIDETEKDKVASFKEHSMYMSAITNTGITLN